MVVQRYSKSQIEAIKNYLDSLGTISGILISVLDDEVIITTS